MKPDPQNRPPVWDGDHTAAELDAMPLASCSRCGRTSSATSDTRCLMPQPDGTTCDGRFVRQSEAGTPGSRRAGPDEHTLGGIPSAEARRAKRESERPRQRTTREIPAIHVPEAPADHQTEPGNMADMPRAGRGMRSPELPPPDHALALEMAVEFLSGPTGQANIGRDGAEALARRVRADHLDMQIIAIGRSHRDGSGAESLIRMQCMIALGIVGDLVSVDRIEQARQWCREFLDRGEERARAMADARKPARIYTPSDDGSCLVCGEFLSAHNVDIDDGCRVAGGRGCPAVAP